MNFLKTNLFRAFALFLFILSLGTVGYITLQDLSWIDALYMSMITISTVGFGEVVPLTQWGKLFTILLILLSIGSFGYLIAVITDYLSNTRLMEDLQERKAIKKIAKLEGHIVICGFGRNGRQALQKLNNYNQVCVVVERDPALKDEIESLGHIAVIGDATQDAILDICNLIQAKSIIAALASDVDNLFVVLSSRQISKDLRIISRASADTSVKKLKIAGADNVILPEHIGGDYMASLVVTPDLVEFVTRISTDGQQSANLREISINDLPEEYLGKSISQLELRKKTGCNVIGYIDQNQNYIINPDASIILEANAHLIVLGEEEQIRELKSILNYG
jgi:voltage-gated potassium channel